MYSVRPLALLVVVSFAACVPGDTAPADPGTLEAMHAQVLQAHLARDADAWTALEADTMIVGNRGTVFRSPRPERLAMRRRYFSTTRFSVYRDLQPPIIQIASDGSQGWLLANVEVIAHPVAADAADSTHTVWAWVELYEKRDGRWMMVGNVSNERPGTLP